jgi:magnesium-transporting ATPase (P-type)
LTALLGMPLALTVRQILAIDLGTDLLPALALGTEKPEPDVMKRPPRRRNQRIVDNGLLARAFLWLGMIEAALCYFGFLFVYFSSGNAGLLKIPLLERLSFPVILPVPADQVAIMAVTVFHAGVVTAQIGNAFACRTEKGHSHRLGWLSNRFLLAGIAVEMAIILSLIYISPLARVFEHVPIPPYFWIGLSLYALVLYGFEWIRKSLARWKDRLLEQKTNGGTSL